MVVRGLENNFRGQASYLECSLSAKISNGWAQTRSMAPDPFVQSMQILQISSRAVEPNQAGALIQQHGQWSITLQVMIEMEINHRYMYVVKVTLSKMSSVIDQQLFSIL